MTSLTELVVQREALNKQIKDMQDSARAAVITQVRTMMAENGVTLADLGKVASATADQSRAVNKVAPKYRDTATASTWSGRGLKPKWLKAAIDGGKSLESFLI